MLWLGCFLLGICLKLKFVVRGVRACSKATSNRYNLDMIQDRKKRGYLCLRVRFIRGMSFGFSSLYCGISVIFHFRFLLRWMMRAFCVFFCSGIVCSSTCVFGIALVGLVLSLCIRSLLL